MSTSKLEKLFTITDLRNAFIAGSAFESNYNNVEIGEAEKMTEPDFGEYVKDVYNIDL